MITRIKEKNDRCEYEQELLIRYDYDNKNDCKRHDSHIQRDYLSHQKAESYNILFSGERGQLGARHKQEEGELLTKQVQF